MHFVTSTVITSVSILRGDKIAKWLRETARRLDSMYIHSCNSIYCQLCPFTVTRDRECEKSARCLESHRRRERRSWLFFADSLTCRWDHRDSLFARGYVCRRFCNRAWFSYSNVRENRWRNRRSKRGEYLASE